MKVVAFNGSARVDGNTSILIDTVFAELKKEGIETKKIHIGAKGVSGCIACMKCWENQDKKCIQTNDKVNDWIAEMISADAVIFGSPVYLADLSGQLKSFMDRAAMVCCANGDLLKRKPGTAVVAVRRAGALPTFQSINSFFAMAQMLIVSSTYWNMGFGMEKGECQQDPEGIQTMVNLGKNMAWLLKSLDYAKDEIKAPETAREVMTNFVR